MVSKKSLENLKKGKRFGPNNPPQNPGRKKSQLKDFRIQKEVSLEDILKVFQGVILDNASTKELVEIAKREDTPALVAGIISAYLHDTRKGGTNALGFIMDRCYGRPTQATVLTVHDVPDDAKQRMLSIFEEGARAPVKPKNLVPKKKAKPKDEL